MPARTARMTLTATAQTYALQTLTSMKAVTVSASSAAQIKGGDPICVIGLNSSANFTVKMEKYAQLQAPNCVVYSNSTNANGLMAMNDAKLTAAMTCSAGGKAGAGPGSFSPTPQTDCPVMPDPLAGRLKPAIGTCSYNNLVVSGQMTTLYPGVYCGGLTITDQSIVTMAAGQYIIKDGPLVVTNAATMNGVNTGFFFTGTGALLNLDALSSISLTAPAAGAMAGMLFWEDAGAASGGTHQIISNDARTLLGTIYLPVNRFHVAANAPVADHSAYTVVVANQFSLSEGPTLVLNTNYGATNIPVPNGVGPGGTSMLIK
jgi:hypothetical protein